MLNVKHMLWCLIGGFSVSLGGAAHAVDFNILTIGDSITFGTGGTSEAIGYQSTLKSIIETQNAGTTANFIGEYQAFEAYTTLPWAAANPSASWPTWPTASTHDYKHYGLPGGTITEVYEGIQNVAVSSGTAQSPGPYTLTGHKLAQRLPSTPNVIVVHLGANDLSEKTFVNSGNVVEDLTDPEVDDMISDYTELLVEINQQFDQAKIMVDLIMPRFGNFGGDPSRKGWNNTAKFNAALKDRLDNIDTSPGTSDPLAAFADKLAYTDLFTLDINDLIALGLSDASLIAAGDQDGDVYVDWGDGYNESVIPTNESGQQTSLYSDGVHPSADGYDLMAWGIYKGLIDANYVPEPGSLALIAVSSLLIVARRRTRHT